MRVILYDSVAYAMDTHDDTTQPKLEGLPSGKGSIKVLLENPNTGRNSAALEYTKKQFGAHPNANLFFSHHQKSVIIDGHIAFLGGIDLAYGRWDTTAFDVVIDRSLHVINDGYNGQLDYARDITTEEINLTAALNGRPGFAAPYSFAYGGMLLDESRMPRQPWQDVAMQIQGPAAFNVFVNFVLRWNSFAQEYISTNLFDSRMGPHWFESAKGPSYLVDPLKKGTGSASVQICRSASSAQLGDEINLWDDSHKYVNDDWKSPNPTRRKAVQKAREAWKGNDQTSIRDAMINCIRSAQGFIYIENQFFMSECGFDRHGTHCPSTNPIIGELANAIGKAIYAERPFHVWLVLPEHPEGHLEEESTLAQTWWVLQGTKQATNSLINRIGATLVKKNLKAWGLASMPATAAQVQKALADHGYAEKWREYLTILNLRNYGRTSTHVITEMVYVHSKLTIVDDSVAIIGSANINDRSLNGNGDTEIAAVVVDDAEAGMTDVGAGVKCITRKFARELRMQLWRKHFGMLVDQDTTGVQKQGCPDGVLIDRPLEPSSIQAIQKLAAANRAGYNEVFKHTPRDSFGTLTEGRKSYSYNDPTERGKILSAAQKKLAFRTTPPLNSAYMTKDGLHDLSKAMDKLRASIKGFLVEMPLTWGAQEPRSPRPPQNAPALIAERKEEELQGESRA